MVNTYKQDEKSTKFSFGNFKKIFKFISPYKNRLLIAFFAGIISGVSLLFIPKVISYAVDVSFVNKNFIQIIELTIFIFLIVCFSLIFNRIKRNQLLIILDCVSNDLKIAVFEKLQYLPITYFDTRSHGKIYTRAATYPDEAMAIFCYVIVDVILDIINLSFVIIFMFTSNKTLSIISLSLSLILIFIFIFLTPIRRRLKQDTNNKIANVNAYISESINGIRVTQSFNREKTNEDILKDIEKKRIESQFRSLRLGELNWCLSGIFEYVSMALVFYIGLRYLYPVVTIGQIMVVDSYSSRFWGPISYLTSSYNEIMEAMTYVEGIFELLDEEIIIKDPENPKKVNIEGNVEFKKVGFHYIENQPVLKNLTFSINKGEKIGLVGETGSGKSTILSLLTRFYDVSDGEILVDGVDLRDISLHDLRSNISMMPQDSFLFNRSVYDNIVLDKEVPLKKVADVCKMLDVDESIKRLDNGYQTVLLNNGSNLSSGERQLICLARIMIQDPKILILDEATSNVDLKTEKKVIKAIQIVSQNRTTIMVAHRLSTIKNCDRIFLIKNKKIFESGHHEELMQKKGEYYKLYSHQLTTKY